jgi:hypothetical protein
LGDFRDCCSDYNASQKRISAKLIKKYRVREGRMPAPNKRFGVMAAGSPQKR